MGAVGFIILPLKPAERVEAMLTVGEADPQFGRVSEVRGHRRPLRGPDLVFAERDRVRSSQRFSNWFLHWLVRHFLWSCDHLNKWTH